MNKKINVIIFRYSPRVVLLDLLDKEKSIIIAPSDQREKYDRYIEEGFVLPQIKFVDDFSFVTWVQEIREIKKKFEINSVTTLSEEDIQLVGMLQDYFVEGKSEYLVSTMFKDKYIMRSFLKGVVDQPDFKLIMEKEDIDEFRKKHEGKDIVIKPRDGAGSQNIRRFSAGEEIDTEYIKDKLNGTCLIEEFVDVHNMITCDGYCIGNKVIRFFIHEYEDLILETFSELTYSAARTSTIYDGKMNITKRALREVKKVINTFSRKDEIVPFHFEWFYSDDRMVFCEVGKRFGGGNIPSLIKYSFDVDVLKEYWDLINNGIKEEKEEVTEDTIMKPNVISAIYMPFKKPGKIIAVPEKEEYDWTKNVWIFAHVGDVFKDSPKSITENLLIAEFISKDEKEYKDNLQKIRNITAKFKYENY